MTRFLFIFLMLSSSLAFSEPRIRPHSWALSVIETDMDNLYWVDEGIYRSEQPNSKNLSSLSKLGVKEILNLREFHGDHEAKKKKFTVHRLKMATGSVTEEQILKALRIIKNRNAPILIHCWHGSDRTGVTIAAYRIIFQNWTKAQAIDEMVHGNYGYHGTFYANLLELLKKMDVSKMQHALSLKPINRDVAK